MSVWKCQRRNLFSMRPNHSSVMLKSFRPWHFHTLITRKTIKQIILKFLRLYFYNLYHYHVTISTLSKQNSRHNLQIYLWRCRSRGYRTLVSIRAGPEKISTMAFSYAHKSETFWPIILKFQDNISEYSGFIVQ